jgi:hypothetical protein
MGKGYKKFRDQEEFVMRELDVPQKRASISQDSGPEIPMGDCVDCHRPWSMFQSEKDWWDKAARELGYKTPRRCRACREIKKAQKQKESNVAQLHGGSEKGIRAQIAQEVRAIAEKFVSESLDDQQLYNELYDLAESIDGVKSAV